MNTVTKLLAAAGFSALLLGGIAIANPGGGGHHGPEHAVLKIVRDLDLSEEQRSALKSIREGNRAEREAAHAEREASHDVLRNQLLSETPDAAALHDLVDQRLERASDRMHDRMDTVLEIQAILTPDQRQQVADELDVLREQRGERGERGPRGRRDHRRGE